MYVIFTIIGIFGIIGAFLGISLTDSYSTRGFGVGMAIVGILTFFVGFFGIITNIAQDSNARECVRQGELLGIESRYDRWDACELNYEGKWYTEDAYLQMKRNGLLK